MDAPIILPTELPPSIDNAAKNLTDKPTEQIGQTIADLFYLVLGGISHAAEKRKLKYQYALDEYARELNERIGAIPEENRVAEPKTQIIAQALEDSKYCVEEPDLRKMFVDLLGSACDKTKAEAVHPSFSGIIKQMSPEDAKSLKMFVEQGVFAFDVAKIEVTLSDHTGYIYIPLKTKGTLFPILNSVSLAFGLFDLEPDDTILFEDDFEEINIIKQSLEKEADCKLGKSIHYVCSITSFGSDFLDACGLLK